MSPAYAITNRWTFCSSKGIIGESKLWIIGRAERPDLSTEEEK